MKIKSDQHCQITITAENVEEAFKLGIIHAKVKDGHMQYGSDQRLELIFPLYQLIDCLTKK